LRAFDLGAAEGPPFSFDWTRRHVLKVDSVVWQQRSVRTATAI
jgi:hypothetical protein